MKGRQRKKENQRERKDKKYRNTGKDKKPENNRESQTQQTEEISACCLTMYS